MLDMVDLLKYFWFFIFFSVVPSLEFRIESEDFPDNSSFVRRQPKILLPFVIPPYPFRETFPRGPCLGTDNKDGICLTLAQCTTRNGAAAGGCAQNRGICCVFVATCGGTVSARVSYFTNVGYPNTFNGGGRCSLTINKAATFICQIRLDYIDLRLASPTYGGVCVDDFFSMGDPSLPYLCGENSGLHSYVDYGMNCDIHKLSVDTSSSLSFARKWNIKITQIPCNSTQRAPRGCLMYFDATSGTVSSFNFRTVVPPPPPNPGMGNTNQLLNLNYGVCVRPGLGYCSIVWSQSAVNPYTFTVSGNSDDAPSITSSARNGMDCTHNFVVIPNPMQTDNDDIQLLRFTDRFCGNALLPTRTSSKPFVLTVVTGPMEETDPELDINNRGFQLDFRQIACKL